MPKPSNAPDDQERFLSQVAGSTSWLLSLAMLQLPVRILASDEGQEEELA
jgi:hypothetical protein